MSVCFFSKKAFSLQIDNYFAFAIFTGSDCLRVCVNIELFNIEQRRFLHNLKWKQPKSPLQIVVLVEGEIEGRVSIAIASSAFVYTNAYFALQNACWGHPKPFHSAPFRCRLRIPAERFLPGDALRVIEDLHQMGCRFI